MAKHTPRRKFSLRRVRVTPAELLGTLASNIVTIATVTPTATNPYRCMSIDGSWSLTDLTANDGPILVGYAHSDYTVTEIKECIEANAAIDQGNLIAREQSNRLVRIVGSLNEVRESLNEGEPIKTKLNWFIGNGDSVVMFAYNESPDTALTDGALLTMSGDMWVKDSV